MEQTPETTRSLTDELKEEIRGAYEALRTGIPGFRSRRAQSQMIGIASRTFAEPGGIAVVEAPTGTGKSLSYLTASIPTAQAHKLKVIISTGTVALQEQLAGRDIPLFLAKTKLPAKTVLVKGRSRYSCPREMITLSAGPQDGLDFGDDEDLSTPAWPRPPRPGEVDIVGRLVAAWDSGKWDGDLDMAPEPVDDTLRPLLTTTGGACSNRKCEFFDRCPFMLAREQVENADLLVVNHSLLLADLMLPGEEEGTFGGVLLPKLSECLVIIDEGHHLPVKARETRAATVHASAVHRRMQKLRNVLRASYQALGKDVVSKLSLSEGHKVLSDLDVALEVFEKQIKMSWVPEDNGKDEPMWRAPMGRIPEEWQGFVLDLSRLSTDAHRWVRGVRRAVMDAQGLPKGAKDTLPRELGMAAERLEQQVSLWSYWAFIDQPQFTPTARWITLTKENTLVFHAGAVSAADFLRDRLFNQAQSVLVTSATISSGGDFRAISYALGLPKHAEVMSLPSPFNLAENGKLIVPAMKASPKDRDAHAAEIVQWMTSDMDWDVGNLALFTSKVKMQAVFDGLPASRKTAVLMQGTQSEAKLLSAHADAIGKGQGSTLFGMASFGEGLDLGGDLCVQVIIANLPFSVPTDPVEATHAEWLEAKGRRPFDEISVPDAIRVLTQYCGRLLRHEDDRGSVVVLDRRLVDTGYGRRMLKALPPFSRQVA